MTRIDELLAALPDDGKRLPPKGRRLLVQGTAGEKPVTRVYDRADAPAQVCEMLRLTGSQLHSYVPEFQPRSQIDAQGHELDGFLALTPDGKQLLFNGTYKTLQFWAPASHELLAEVHGLGSKYIAFSPDGRQAVLGDGSESYLVETTTWKPGPKLESTSSPATCRTAATSSWGAARSLCKSTGRHREAHPAIARDPGGRDEASPRPQKPPGRPATRGREGGALGSGGATRLATLRENDRLADAVFSPDESLVAVSTRNYKRGRQKSSLGLWRADTGALVHELRPFEQVGQESAVGLLWSPDGAYVLAGAFPDMGSGNIICVFSAQTGRHRGQFVDRELWRLNGVVLLPDASELVAGDSGGKIRFWDFPAAMRAIREFEKTLALPPPP